MLFTLKMPWNQKEINYQQFAINISLTERRVIFFKILANCPNKQESSEKNQSYIKCFPIKKNIAKNLKIFIVNALQIRKKLFTSMRVNC